METRKNRRRTQGFTLTEMLVVIAMIAILAALLLPVFNRTRQSAKRTQCIATMHSIGVAVKQYFLDHKRYPRTLTDLQKYLDFQIDTNRASPTFGIFQAGSDKVRCPHDLRVPPGLTSMRSSYGGFAVNPAIPQAPLNSIGNDCTDASPEFYASNHPENCPDSNTASFGTYNAADPRATSALANTLQRHWNYWGFDNLGLALRRVNSPYFAHACYIQRQGNAPCNVDGALPAGISSWANYPALGNPSAPDNTIVMHCFHHRPIWGEFDTANNVWNGSTLELYLQLGGNVKVVNTTSMQEGAPSKWVVQGE